MVLILFWLSSPEVAKQRVARRVEEGGHNIPEDVIRRRYYAGLKNLFGIYSHIVDRWVIIDNNTCPSVVVAEMENGINRIHDFDRYQRIMEGARHEE